MPRHGLVLLAAASLSLVIVSPVVGQQAPAASPTVTLVDAGEGPRQELRYRFEEGYSEQLALDLTTRTGMSMAGQQMPAVAIPVRMLMTIRTTEVADDGTARFEFDTTSVELGGDLANAGLGNLAGNAGLSGWIRVDSRGNTIEGGVTPPTGADPGVSQITDGFEQSLQQMSAPLPAEPVGIGARWQVVTSVDGGGFTISQTADYTLASRNGDDCEMAVALTQTAPAQPFNVPGMPPGTEARLESLEGTGDGTMRINLARLVPTSEASMSLTGALGIAIQGMSMQMGLNIENEVSIAPAAD